MNMATYWPARILRLRPQSLPAQMQLAAYWPQPTGICSRPRQPNVVSLVGKSFVFDLAIPIPVKICHLVRRDDSGPALTRTNLVAAAVSSTSEARSLPSQAM